MRFPVFDLTQHEFNSSTHHVPNSSSSYNSYSPYPASPSPLVQGGAYNKLPRDACGRYRLLPVSQSVNENVNENENEALHCLRTERQVLMLGWEWKEGAEIKQETEGEGRMSGRFTFIIRFWIFLGILLQDLYNFPPAVYIHHHDHRSNQHPPKAHDHDP